MVGLLGCGCCNGGPCCPLATPDWSESFATTPTLADPWDEVTEISGSGCKSICPAPSSSPTTKTSRLRIDADSASPIYLGFTGWPNGGFWFSQWTHQTATTGEPITSSMQNWTAPVPTPGQTNSLAVSITHQLIFQVGSDTIRTGAFHSWQKDVSRPSGGGAVVNSYTALMYGFQQVNNSAPTIQTQYGPFTITGATGHRIGFTVRHFFPGQLISTDCTAVWERKQALSLNFNLGADWLNLRTAGNIERNSQRFACNLGWETTVVWATTRGTGGTGFGVGNFDYKGSWIQWQPVDWTNWPGA
jgi:hypothetical protein